MKLAELLNDMELKENCMDKLNIFVSWSGRLSQGVASAMNGWLEGIIPGTKTWMSSEDIAKGKPWFSAIASQIGQSPVCLICVTKKNIHSPWLYFEAGGIHFAMQDPYVCPFLVNVEAGELSGTPLGQLQCTKYEKEDTWRLIRDVNLRLASPNDEQLVRDSNLALAAGPP